MNKKGVALLLALFTLVFVSMMVIAFLDVTTSDLQITSNHLKRTQALYLADAGVEYAVYRLRNSKRPNLPASPTELPSGSGNTYLVTYDYNSGKIISSGALASGEAVSLEVKVSVTGSTKPFKVQTLYWKEL